MSAMSALLALPVDYVRSVLVEWLNFPDVVRIDTAHASISCRERFLAISTTIGPAFKNKTKMSNKAEQCLEWLKKKKIQVDKINIPRIDVAVQDYIINCGAGLVEVQLHIGDSSPSLSSFLTAQQCPFLEIMEVYLGRNGELDEFYENLSTSWPGLKKLHIMDYNCVTPFVLPNLIDFKISFSIGAVRADDTLLSVVQHSPQLIHLSISVGNTSVDLSTAAAIGQHCTQLLSLALSGEGITHEHVMSMLPACQNLSTLHLSYTSASQDTLAAIAHTCTKLTRFELDGMYSLPLQTNTDIKTLIRRNPQLTELSLVDCIIFDMDQLLNFIAASCLHLERLELTGGFICDASRLRAVGAQCPMLKLIRCSVFRSGLPDPNGNQKEQLKSMFPAQVKLMINVIDDISQSSGELSDASDEEVHDG